MSCQIRLVLAIHNHQPIGNFEGVCEQAFRDSYAPFLDVLEDYPELPISLHNSGSLLEWLATSHPEYIDQVRSLVDRGQVEILGGPFYEPILGCIPRRDRVGQIVAYSRYLKQLFGADVRGMWVPERVWEQAFASDIARAGIEYTLLDDFHFRGAGLSYDQLWSYFLTEDEGRLLKVFPGSERLRYTIPFQDPEATIDHLRHLANEHPNSICTFGDDGEKFGTWPNTKKHVYENGWLRRFFDALMENADWLKVATLAEAVDQVAPAGDIYIPDCSYREMTEWALPTKRQTELKNLEHDKKHDPEWASIRSFIRGGFWRNFRVKYAESQEMYARMLGISERLEELTRNTDPASDRNELLNRARTELYRGQCNCSYWHGAFGGLYLPHLRNAVYRHLIAADTLLERAEGRSENWLEIASEDYNRDGRKEVRLASDRFAVWLAPASGGHLYELDIRSTRHNLLATLNRRPEPYHDVVIKAGQQQHGDHEHDGDGVASIHDMVHFKQPDLDKKIAYDNWPRKSLVDHFLQPGLALEDFMKNQGEVGDFVGGVYDAALRRSDNRVEAVLSRQGNVGPYGVKLTKTVALDNENPGQFEVVYRLENLPPDVPIHFAVEFNFAGLAAGAPDRYYYDAHRQPLGQLETIQSLPATDRIGLVDEWLGVDASLELSHPAEMWTFPIQTISQSEGGFELVHQSSAVVPHWQFTADETGRWGVRITMKIDTSTARIHELSEVAVMC
jgi:4-alpha-glucanotransferase